MLESNIVTTGGHFKSHQDTEKVDSYKQIITLYITERNIFLKVIAQLQKATMESDPSHFSLSRINV